MKQLRFYRFTPLILVGIINLIVPRALCQEGAVTTVEGEVNHGENLIKWLRKHGGVVNDKIEIRRADPSDPTSRFGMFTNGDIRKREILLVIPRGCLITDVPRNEASNMVVEDDDEEDDDEEDDDEEDDDEKDDHEWDEEEEDEEEEREDVEEEEEDDDEDIEEKIDDVYQCATIRNLITEMRLGDDSYYAPYVNYLLAEPWGQLPSSWSVQGKRLLNNILHSTKRPLPPLDPMNWENVWSNYCSNGSKDPFEVNASLMVAQRSWDDILIPVFDMMSHRNGKWLNTESSSVHDETTDITVKAKRPIYTGGEIYTSYNMCEDCGNRAYDYGTPEILRDYGFVEQYPQRYIFPDAVGFEIDDEDADSGSLSLSWIDEEPNYDDISLLKNVQHTMAELAKTLLLTPSTAIPDNEIATIRQYHEDLTKATNLALETAYVDDEACSTEEQNCVVPSTRYGDLMQDKEINYSELVCGNMDENLEFEDYQDLETIKSPYQHLGFKHHPKTNDVCFDLDETCQICGNYRPHYHEMSVHYAARYLEKVGRALFVGGGDSMLLYELLQYPSIELIVGLELDQTVPRSSFKYFGTQPHWDNDKVEWWFGDATKSLTILPKDYFGSFDMVLVDLSETVMSLSVTKKLDVMKALSLLLKPDGVMLKNEVYFEEMGDIFEHTLQYWYYDVPVICSQSMVIGSNSINFVRQENLTDHNVHNLLIGPLDYDRHFELYHDYAWHPENREKNCVRENDELEQVPLRQTDSPGIIMIVEAEDTSVTVDSIDEMEELLTKTLSHASFNVISTFMPETDEDNVVIVVMKEGYVVSHFWPDNNYCGFDVYLWSSFSKQEILKKTLLLAVGSKSSSSFRIVTSGMFGMGTWKDDFGERGPRRTLLCNSPENTVHESGTNSDTMQIIVEEEMKALEESATVLVVCGLKSSLSCSALETLEKMDNVEQVIDVWSCPDVNEFAKDSSMQLYFCERNLLELLNKRLVNNKKLDAIIFDSTSSYSMGQILVRVFTNLKTRFDLLAKDPKILAISYNVKDEWRSILVNRFRTDIFEIDPVFKVDVLFKGTDSNIYVQSVVTDEKNIAVKNLRHVLTAIEKRSGVHANVEEILGGGPIYEEEFTPTRVYTSDDYDQTSQLDQWSSQLPLGYQAILQLEVQGATKIHLNVNKVKVALEQTLSLVSSIKHNSSTAQVKEISNIGDGCLLIALWSGCRVIVIWDGRKRVGINLTTNEENFEYTSKFQEAFINQIPSLKAVLCDEHPRGYGKVVNFLKDIEDEEYPEPVWA